MKTLLLMTLIYASVFMGSRAPCDIEDDHITTENDSRIANGIITITINSKTFTATLLDTNSAKAFKELLPVTINMTELNGNEKYYDFSNSLPTDSSNPGSIKNGDLMLYGSKTLVLFYKSFSTPYSYTRLGSIDDPTGLEEALGSGYVSVTLDNN